MPRMRTVKPEFWDSPSTAKADLAVRLTYIAMWNWADDSGRGTANLKELEAFCFPHDDICNLPRGTSGGMRGNSGYTAGAWRNFAEICGEVAEVYGVNFYKVHGRPYYVIPNFRKHQAKDFRETSRYPKEDEGYFFDITSGNAIGDTADEDGSSGNSGHRRGTSGGTRGKKSPVIGEQGKRVIGEQGKKTCSPDGEREGSNATDEPPSVNPTNEYPDAFEEWWNLYPRKQGKRKALSAWRQATKRVSRETLNEQTKLFADFHDREATDKQFIPHPTTWLNRDGWNDELIPRRTERTDRTPDGTRPEDWLTPQDTNPPNGWLAKTGTDNIIDGDLIPTWPQGELTW